MVLLSSRGGRLSNAPKNIIGLLAGGLIAAGLWASGAQGANPDWELPAGNLSQPGNVADYPQVATGPSGSATAVWSWMPPGGGLTYVQAATRRAGQSSFDAAANLSGPDVDGFLPQIAIEPDGETTVLWVGLAPVVAYDVTMATRPAGQATFGGPRPMSVLPSFPAGPQLAMTPDGSVAAIWVALFSQVPLIQTATRPAGKASFDAPQDIPDFGQPLSTTSPDPQVTLGQDGTTTAAWIGETSGLEIVRAATRPAGGDSFGVSQDLSERAPDLEDVHLVTAPDGTVTAIWAISDGYGWSIQTATRPGDQATFGRPQTLSSAGLDAIDPQLALTPDGSAVAIWTQSIGTETVIQAADRPAGEASFGAPQNLSEPGEDAADPDLAIAPDGAVTAVWSRFNGTYKIIQTAARPPDQDLFGAPQNLSEPGEDATNPGVAVAPDGAATAVWPRSEGPDFLIQGARSAPTTYPITVEVNGPGKVTSSPAGINCRSSCSASFSLSSSVTLTATPKSGATLSRWGDSCSGKGAACSVDVLGSRTATARFIKTTVRVTSARAKSTGNGVRVSSRVKVSGAGRLKQRVASGTRTWCRASRSVSRAGTFELSCNLGRKGRRALRERRLRLGLPTIFTPTGGSAVTSTRKLTVKRG